ncbi:MAG: triose-phosphate isomerase [bacterium]|nr:triose-phosphate isomerase [bacterium]
MRKPIIAGNWKMNLPPSAAVRFANVFDQLLPLRHPFEVVLFPPFVSILSVRNVFENRNDIGLGGQNVSEYEAGAYTGEISAEMLLEVGCQYVLIGHSERRHIFGETEEGLRKKLTRAVHSGLIPVFCIGERLSEREKGETHSVLEHQLLSLIHLTDEEFSKVVLAYEPVWAIGTGVNATPEQAQEAHAFIRKFLNVTRGELAYQTRILYGGSVTPSNAKELFSCEDVDGMLVGGASLKPESFYSICEVAFQ